MIKSMTGFCKAEVQAGGKVCSVEMRSVNHRHLDARVTLPKAFGQLEEDLKKALKTHLTRGKVDVLLHLVGGDIVEEKIEADLGVWKGFKEVLAQLESGWDRKIQVSLNDLTQIKGLLQSVPVAPDDYDYPALFQQAVEEGARLLAEMRAVEGNLLKTEILGHVTYLEELIAQVPQYEAEVVQLYKDRLANNLAKLDLSLKEDDPRIAQEIGFFVDRADVTEEVERFRTHLTHLRTLLDAEEPVGRKLDFMMQELNREANTLCSKAGHQKITEIGVTLKTEIEKIREQVQNIE
ncbi:MAG: YicC/YloC family endoribonuclease [bacterium]|nr:YicC/YloC family endoribonuclease [bacterium]